MKIVILQDDIKKGKEVKQEEEEMYKDSSNIKDNDIIITLED